MRRSSLLVLLLVLISYAVYGSGSIPPPTRYEVSTTVLESPEHRPQLCLGGGATTMTQKCSGPDIVGWDWNEVDGEESVSGTTWGDFRVVGTYEAGVFTLIEPPGPPQRRQGEQIEFTSPCPAPEGGWAVGDADLATDPALDDAVAYAQAQSDFAGLWLDQSINPASSSSDNSVIEAQMNDPTKLVLNVRFTGDLETHEAQLRTVWGGSLCVSPAERTEAELLQIQSELSSTDGLLWSSTDILGGTVELGVIVDDGTIQESLDESYGKGVVEVIPALQPLS